MVIQSVGLPALAIKYKLQNYLIQMFIMKNLILGDPSPSVNRLASSHVEAIGSPFLLFVYRLLGGSSCRSHV